jgi:serine/threonine protein kinase/tetratricopeptide (TPR) repeat protein
MNTDPNPGDQVDPGNAPIQPVTTPYRAPTERPDTRIGPYKLLQEIGEGGFGIVYMAEQDAPVHRRVALKVIKPGMDSAQVIARFEAERQALALMDHQNIAKVYDAGSTDNGHPFFVMELVHGVPITTYCDDNHLTVGERLTLFVPLCKAIQHAHQKGIIHRDLKPSNVLVCLYDGQPVPKVIDFGVAKAIEQRLTEHTMFTQYGQIVGTFEYMSPEQAEMSQLGVDTRSDVYSLGVMLYELLTGSTPLARQRLREASPSELLRIIKEEEPPKPSTRLSSTREAAKIAAARRTEPLKLGKLLRGELDWVVMKCLEKDRARRYDTANGLAQDLERYLHDEPVEAGPPGAGYRLRKLAKKHHTTLGIAGTIVALLVLAACVSTWLAVRAVRAERVALAERDRAEASFRMARDTVDDFFTQVGDSPQLKAKGLEKFRKDLLEKAKDFYERFIREHLDAPEVRHDLGLAHLRLAKIHDALGDYAVAEGLSQKAIDILGELVQAHGDAAEYRRDLAAGHVESGDVAFAMGRSDKAEAAYQHALDIQERLADDHAGVAEYWRALATTQAALGRIYFQAGQYEKAQGRLEQALAIWTQLVQNNAQVPENRFGLASMQQGLGTTFIQRGRTEEAEASLKEAVRNLETLAREYPDVPSYHLLLARTYMTLGNLYGSHRRQTDKAEEAYQQALRILKNLTRQHPDVLAFVYNLGVCYTNLAVTANLAGRPGPALTRFDEAIETLEHVVSRGYSVGRIALVGARINRSSVLVDRGDHSRATDEASALAKQEDLDPTNLYNVASVFGRSSVAAEKDTRLAAADRTRLKAHYADRAIEFLHRAVGKGYQSAPALTSDPSFASLRSRDDFQSLVQEVERRSKK